MTRSEFKNTTMSGSPSGNSRTSSSNNMNSRVNKHVGQLPENLRLNGKTPSGKPRLFVCQICTRAFARQEHLTRHERSHTKEKPYSCGICNRNFSRRDLLLRHAHKVHGGNAGDSIIRHNKSKVAKKRQSTTTTRPSRLSERPEQQQQQQQQQLRSNGVLKRRASFSAQSENYMATPANEENHKFDRVKFSTPELLPVDFEEDSRSGCPTSHGDSGASNGTIFDNALPHINLDTPHDFNFLDSVNWINDYNNEPVVTSGTGSKTGATNSPDDDDSPASHNGSAGHRLSSNLNNPSNIRSSWSINEADGALQMKSLFSDRSPSYSSTDNSVLPQSSAAQSNPHLPSITPGASDSIKIQNPNNSGIISEQLKHFQFEDNIGKLTNYSKDVQSVLGKMANEPFSYSAHEVNFDDMMEFTTPKAESVRGTFDSQQSIPSNGYTFYGLDPFALADISRASQAKDIEVDELPPSTIFTPELMQMCDRASQYYNDHYNGGLPSENPSLTSKTLTLPSCNELNTYVSYYQKYFNSHHPSIHPDFFSLDLQTLRKYVHESEKVDEELDSYLQHSNLACLPLFVATVGSLYKPGCSLRTMELYEISRRVLHVFLERRKSQQGHLRAGGLTTGSGQHVWLIQSLTLSIIFALFADNLERIDTMMLKRQVSAVCSIIKNNFMTLVAVGDGERSRADFNFDKKPDIAHFDSSFEYIIFESKIRCTFNAYKFCQFLRTFYHVDAKLFLNEQDLRFICIPDDENTWSSASLRDPLCPMAKRNVVSFENYYHSFAFNSPGMNPIPESLASILLYHEYNTSTSSAFHIFLTKIDTKKLEINLHHSYSNSNIPSSDKLDYASVLKSDSVILRNCLMSIFFFSRIDTTFGSKIWNGHVKELFATFLHSKSQNLLTKGSYSLLTDFLVALNYSIKNIANILKPIKSLPGIYLDKQILSMFNLQAYHNDFLILIKFIKDFEYSPNFKLLCIFTELKKLANRLLLPYFSKLYPLEFAKFEDVSSANDYFQQHPMPNSTPIYSTINVDKLEKLINNVLVYSFNDASFLKMSDQPIAEFSFNNSYPTYNPLASSVTSTHSSLITSTGSTEVSSEASHPISHLFNNDSGNNYREVVTSDSADNLLGANSLSHPDPGKDKQRFDERYRLSEKYIVIAKCFFMHVKESYAHCHILDKMTNNFRELEMCLERERSNSIFATEVHGQDAAPQGFEHNFGAPSNANDIQANNTNGSTGASSHFLRSEA